MCWIGMALSAMAGGTIGGLMMAMMSAAANADRMTDEWYRQHGNTNGNHH